jgi:hypothetical protein
MGSSGLTANCVEAPASPTLVTNWPAVEGGVAVIEPADAADKK